jgi:ribonuclease HI
MAGWQKRAFKGVKNPDLWQALLSASAPHKIDWQWVRGHSGHIENERVDEAARKAAEPYGYPAS